MHMHTAIKGSTAQHSTAVDTKSLMFQNISVSAIRSSGVLGGRARGAYSNETASQSSNPAVTLDNTKQQVNHERDAKRKENNS